MLRSSSHSHSRALPLYASLLSLGRTGYASLFARNVAFARLVTDWLRSHPNYDVLLPSPSSSTSFIQMNIVLFAPSSHPSTPPQFRGPEGAARLLKAVNATRQVYCTGTNWRGRGAIRLAVSNWRTEAEGEGRDWEVVKGVLEGVMRE